MQTDPNSRPVVLCIAGHDPVGGAGIQADIETLAALGCHAATAITCQTVQDTRNVGALRANDPGLLMAQIEAICDDLTISCVKIGLLGSADLTAVVSAALSRLTVPVVLDPVLAAGGGQDLAADGLIGAIRGLLPQITLVTPNRAEARRLSRDRVDCAEQAARRLLQEGCDAILLTGADESTGDRVLNQLYTSEQPPNDYHWPLLEGRYHGSGCTLASACAAHLARGYELAEAAERAQHFTWQALNNAHSPGQGQSIPGRIRNAL